MKNKVSIIVPIYNSEIYLVKLLDSLINQTYKKIEIILVNDGSTDSSLSICKSYKERDNRIKIINENNSGVSFARNNGIKNATGDYILFVDSDDYVDSDFVNRMLDSQYDLVVSNVGSIYFQHNNFSFYEDPINNCLNQKLYFLFLGPMCKLYKRDILNNNNILFNTSMNYGEDTLFNIMYINNCHNVKIIDYSGYNMQLTQNSLSRKYVNNAFDQMKTITDYVCNNHKFSLINKDFWRMRGIKVYLANETKNKYKTFKDNSMKCKELDFDKIELKNLGFKNKIIYCLIKSNCYFLLYFLLKK